MEWTGNDGIELKRRGEDGPRKDRLRSETEMRREALRRIEKD